MKISKYILIFFINLWSGSSVFCQDLFKEEYAVINAAFGSRDFDVSEERNKVFFQTSELKIWIGLLLSDDNDYLGKNCLEVKDFAKAKFGILRNEIDWLPNVELDSSRVDGSIEITRDPGPKSKKICLPLIVEDLAFLFFYFEGSQAVLVLKKSEIDGWRNACSIIIYSPPFVDYMPISK